MKKIISVNNLRKCYHTKDEEIVALDDISFDISIGEFVSIVGPSGCGKSTILSILSDLLEPSSGNVSIDNKYSFSYMLQSDCLLPFKTVYENCLIGLRIKKKYTKENLDYVNHLLKLYGLEQFKNQYPSSLSGGMRQRVALIRTLATKPDIILLDEATSALDYQTTLSISEDIYRIIKEEGKTAIMVTHDIPLAISMSDKVYVLSKRPAKIKKIYDIDLCSDSPIKRRQEKKFGYYYKNIWEDLENEV